MKGYSFDELVKLAEAAFPREGGNITGSVSVESANGVSVKAESIAMRMAISGGIGYYQAGKEDRDPTNQKMRMSGWLGTRLTELVLLMADGVQPTVDQGGTKYPIYHRNNLPSIDILGAAPAGFGLGGTGVRPPDDDCDKAVANGYYGIFSNTLNKPAEAVSGSKMHVWSWGANYVSQIVTQGRSTRTWIRTSYDTSGARTWSPWAKMYTEDDKPTSAEVGALSIQGGTTQGTGNIAINRLLTGNAYLSVSGVEGAESQIRWREAQKDRATFVHDPVNKRMAFNIYDDAGTYLRRSFNVSRETGDLTVDQKLFIVGSQSAEGTAATRRDYVDGELAKKANLAGANFTGAVTAPALRTENVPTYASDVLNLSYASGQVPKRATRLTLENLNDIVEPGIYYQPANNNASNSGGYPQGLAGTLKVYIAAGIVQEYNIYNNSRTYRRTLYSGVWSDWSMTYDQSNKPSAAEVGALSLSLGGTVNNAVGINGTLDVYYQLTAHNSLVVGKGLGVEGDTQIRGKFALNGNMAVSGSLQLGQYAKMVGETNVIFEAQQAGVGSVLLYKPAGKLGWRMGTGNGNGGEVTGMLDVDTTRVTTVGIPLQDRNQTVFSPHNRQPVLQASDSSALLTKDIGRYPNAVYVAMVQIRNVWTSITFTEHSILNYGATILNMGGEHADQNRSGTITATVVNATTLRLTATNQMQAIGMVYAM